MLDFLDDVWLHGICMLLCGYVLSLAWSIAWIDNRFSLSFPFFGITMVICILQLDFFLVGAHNPLWLWVGTNVLKALK